MQNLLIAIRRVITKRPPEGGPPIFFMLLWLVYILFPISALGDRPAEEQWVGYPVIIVFIVSYIAGHLSKRWRIWAVIIHLLVITYFSWRYNENFIYMGFFTASLIGMLPNLRQIGIALSCELLLFGVQVWHYENMNHLEALLELLPAMVAVLLVPFVMFIGRRSKLLRTQLELANDEISRLSKQEERQRISRELHDTLGHTLTMITLKSELAEKLIVHDPDRAKQEIRDVQLTSRAALKQVRELVSGMNTVTLQDELSNAKRILAAAFITLNVQGDPASAQLSPLIDNILGMCLREAVTNVVKHSEARHCVIEWAMTPDQYRLAIRDNGIGCDTVEKGPAHNGIRGMQERLNLVDGRLDVQSVKGTGTCLNIMVPRVRSKKGE
ncbi:two-component system, NarL family, sensor histidine kinase DesK [Paenibacillus catalpae]|uniref:histidine kinase n=1 Tax=Paenibacillus catalpae TaxID=1045775 RepID=A0A1I2D984_9BACL|nr:sensor histidine kinase [Paenibacillus catalpae]SFE77011.1 two-component system, NarL family, sensor histidine kinase DesK [Paenibacillus catalpae]